MVNQELLDKAIIKIECDAIAYRYFFEKLTSPNWAQPLKNRGYFSVPPDIEEKGDYLALPFWPESEYLARVAKQSPEVISQIAIDIPETNNPRVHRDLIDIALNLPIELTCKLVKKEIQWLKQQKNLYGVLSDKYASLINYLLQGETKALAFEATNYLLDFTRVKDEFTLSDDSRRTSYSAKPLISDYEYEELIKKILPTMLEASAEEALKLFSTCLQQYIICSKSEYIDKYQDSLFISRPAIEDHEQNHRYKSIQDILIDAVRDSALFIIERNPERIESTVLMLESYQFSIFKRVALYLLSLYPNKQLTEERLISREFYTDSSIHHEFYALLSSGYGLMDAEHQNTILEWIDSDTSLEAIQNEWSKDTPLEDIEKSHKYRLVKAYEPIKEYLPPDRKSTYKDYLEEVGPPNHPGFTTWSSGTWIGPESPKSYEEFLSMDAQQTIDFLNDWQPTEYIGPSPEGINRILSDVISSKPNDYVCKYELFKQLEPTYIRALIEGLTKALSKNSVFAIENAFDLCEWVLKQSDESVTFENDIYSRDKNWRNARKSIIEFCSQLVSQNKETKEETLGIEYKDKVWSIISQLTNDPEPSAEYESKYGKKDNIDPLTRCINTIRGVAIETSIKYGLWIKRQSNSKNLSLNHMPELRKVLDDHLSPGIEKSPAIRAAYGMYFENLYYIDNEWLKKSINKIFLKDEDNFELRKAAWETFLAYNSPSTQAFELLINDYLFSVNHIHTISGNHEALESLGEHIIVYYYWGNIEIEEDGVLFQYLKSVPSEYKNRLINFIGRQLIHTPDKSLLDRLKRFWEWRLTENDTEELSAFGWWFKNSPEEDSWFLEQLESLLKATKTLNTRSIITDKLESIYAVEPEKIVDILSLIVDCNDYENYGLYDIKNTLTFVIEKSIVSQNQSLAFQARELTNKIINKGYLEFREFLTA